MNRVLIVGGGFAGLNAATRLGRAGGVEVTLVDRRNHHLFQPLLYQVAMAGLSPADIAVPIRSLMSRYHSVRVLQVEVNALDLKHNSVTTDVGELAYDYLLLACGVRHSYFGRADWEEFAPGLKTVEQATEIRRRVLLAFEEAERISDPEERRRQLTFVIVGGGPTGVELAGAIGEMTRFTLARDFHHIDAKLARIMLIHSGPRILPTFVTELSSRATRDLEKLGVQVWTSSRVTEVDAEGVKVGTERIRAATVLWAAGIEASPLGREPATGKPACWRKRAGPWPASGLEVDRQGRIIVEPDLSLKGYPNVFVAGDLAHFAHQTGSPLLAMAPVALQQGRFVAQTILNELRGKPRESFCFRDRGQMATIGRSKAIIQMGKFRLAGWFAWVAWLFLHIFYLTGVRNRLFVVLHWGWSYCSFRRGARLIVNKEWRFSPNGDRPRHEPHEETFSQPAAHASEHAFRQETETVP